MLDRPDHRGRHATRCGRSEFSARELTEAHLAAIEALNPRLNAFITVTAERALAQADAADAALVARRGRAAHRHSAGDQGSVLHRGRAHHRRQPHPRAVRAAVRKHRHRQPAARRRGVPRQGEHGRVRHGLVQHDHRPIGPVAESVERRQDDDRGAGARRLVRRLGGGGGGAAGDWVRPAPTPAARSASRRRSAAIVGHQADLRPLLALGRRGVRLVARPGRAVRAHGAGLRDPARLAWRGTIRRIPPAPIFRCRISRRRARAACKGLRIGVPREYRVDGMPAEIEALWQQGLAWLRDAGAEIVDVSLPHTKYGLATYYIVAPAEASSNLARYDGVRFGLREDGEDLRDLYERTRAAGVWCRGAAAHPDRHLCAVGRLLRRLLPAGAEGAGADPARLHRGVRACGRAADADRAVGGVRAGREDGRSGDRCI